MPAHIGHVRRFVLALLIPFCVLPLASATLERLSLTDMITKSTAIVRGKVQSSYAAFSGRVIYTHYSVQVTEQYKGNPATTIDVVVPGGVANGIEQNYAGAPTFRAGEEYVFFIWTSKTGLNWIVGLTQGLFAVSQDSVSNPSVTRTASRELMLDGTTHQQVKDQTLNMRLGDLRSQIATTLGVAK